MWLRIMITPVRCFLCRVYGPLWQHRCCHDQPKKTAESRQRQCKSHRIRNQADRREFARQSDKKAEPDHPARKQTGEETVTDTPAASNPNPIANATPPARKQALWRCFPTRPSRRSRSFEVSRTYRYYRVDSARCRSSPAPCASSRNQSARPFRQARYSPQPSGRDPR
jgi:hypothetical protein